MNSSKEAVRPSNANTSVNAERDGQCRKPGRKPKPKALIGRPPKLVNQIDRAMRTLDANLPALIDKLIELAYTKGDKDIIMYLIDRKMGRPASQVNANVKGAIITVSPDDYATAIATARAAEMALLSMPTLVTPTLQEE